MTTIGQRLRAARQAAHYTAAQLAREAEISRHTIISVEADAHSISVHTLQRIAAILGVRCAQLLGEEEGRHADPL